MLIMPSFKKSLIVEQFQGNYLKRNLTLLLTLRLVLLRISTITININSGVYFDYRGVSLDKIVSTLLRMFMA